MSNKTGLDPTFYLNNGDLTKYALKCGYCERKVLDGNHKTLYMEHDHYHVQAMVNNERIWETFDSKELTKARLFYSQINL